jgi:hypothetical protein
MPKHVALAVAAATLTAALAFGAGSASAQNVLKQEARQACKEVTAKELKIPINTINTEGKLTSSPYDKSMYRFGWTTTKGAAGVCRVRDGVVRGWEITYLAPNQPSPASYCRQKVAGLVRVDAQWVSVTRTGKSGDTVMFDWQIGKYSGTCRVKDGSRDAVVVVR